MNIASITGLVSGIIIIILIIFSGGSIDKYRNVTVKINSNRVWGYNAPDAEQPYRKLCSEQKKS